MKLVFNKSLKNTVNEILYTDPNDHSKYTEYPVVVYCINVLTDIRIELDSYVLTESELQLLDLPLIIECQKAKLIDYNDLRKYLIVYLLPSWDSLSSVEQALLKSYYIVPNDYVWEANQLSLYKMLVYNATACREARIDDGRSYVSLFYINDVQKSIDFFIDTELLMNQYVKGKIPALQAFINDDKIASFDYTTNGFSTKSYYSSSIKDQLNYLLFR